MKGRTVAIATIAATALVLAGAFALHRRPEAGKEHTASLLPRADRALIFKLQEGASKVYAWSLTTLVWSGPTGTSPHETSYEGTLNFRVLPGAPRPTLAIQLSPISVHIMGERNPTMEKAFTRPFTIEIDREGRFGEARFPQDLAQNDRAVLEGAIRSFQIVLPSKSASDWELSEEDQNGKFMASYRLEQAGVITKSRTRYLVPQTQSAFSMRILESSVRAETDRSGLWLASSEGSELMQIETEGGRLLARIQARFSLKSQPGVPADGLAFWKDPLRDPTYVSRDAPSTAMSAWDEVDRKREVELIEKGGVTLDKLVAGLDTHASEDAAFTQQFATFLRVFPQQTKRLPSLGQLSDAAAARLALVLELAGTPEAQEALTRAVDGAESKANWVRALAAIAGLEHPTPETIDCVKRAASTSSARETDDIFSTALLTLGALANNAPDALGAEIREQLEDGLRSAATANEQMLHLRALENAHAPLPPAEASQYLRSESPAVRAAAAGVVAGQQDAAATEAIIQSLSDEADASVRMALVAGLTKQAATPLANSAIAQGLPIERDARVRTRMVAYLASRTKAFPANRAILESELKQERDRGVIVAILNALAR